MKKATYKPDAFFKVSHNPYYHTHITQSCWQQNLAPYLTLLPPMVTYMCAVMVQGLLLPLCQAGDCNLREAVILSSVLKRVSLPVLHSAAALLRIADMAYSGTNSFFIRVLLDKKYALPYRVVRTANCICCSSYHVSRCTAVLR